MDMGNYIGFTNSVYDVLQRPVMPRGSVPLNVLVSMCTNYAYVGPDDARFPEMRAQIEALYRTVHAEDYNDPNDERLAAMWLLMTQPPVHCSGRRHSATCSTPCFRTSDPMSIQPSESVDSTCFGRGGTSGGEEKERKDKNTRRVPVN